MSERKDIDFISKQWDIKMEFFFLYLGSEYKYSNITKALPYPWGHQKVTHYLFNC